MENGKVHEVFVALRAVVERCRIESMSHEIDAIYDHGVFRPVEPLALPEGIRVHLRIVEESMPSPGAADGQAVTLLERLKNVVGTIDDLPEDSSINLDHYVHGHPQR